MKIAVLAGDGIGPEIMEEATKVLSRVGEIYGHDFAFQEALIGGAAYDRYGEYFPESTKKICEGCEAILFGSVGGPVSEQGSEKWKNCEREALLGLRKYFDFSINLRPVKVYESLKGDCVLRSEIVEKGIDILCVRELSQDVYFGTHEISGEAPNRTAKDMMTYDEKTIENIAHAAFKAAGSRKKEVISVDKANVLDCSKLWREVVERVAKEYPDVSFEHMLVDNCSMQVLRRPFDFDVLLMPNMFGDIISDEVSVFAGSLGMLPSASLNSKGFGMYEPSGGSAPDIAGLEIANPIGMILSAALMLKYSFGLGKEHDAVVKAVSQALDEGYRTKDIAGPHTFVSTTVMGDSICKFIN